MADSTDTIKELIQNASLDVVAYDIHIKKSMNLYDRDLPVYIMSYIKQGEATLAIDGRKYKTGPGSIILIPPHVAHAHYKETDEETVFLWWHFHFRIAGLVDAMKVLNVPRVIQMQKTEAFEKAFYNYYEISHTTNTLPGTLLRKARGLEVMAMLLENIITDESVYRNVNVPDIFISILSGIINLQYNKLSLSDLENQYHLNSTYISNKFKEYFGVSPIALHRQAVFEKAKLLLRMENMPIGEIAEVLGFSDLFTFTRYFTSKEGMSPKAYRNMTKGIYLS